VRNAGGAKVGMSDVRGNHSKGKPVELFIAAYCMLASRNQLNVATSYIDDEGVDLFVNRWRGKSTLALQVKSKFSDSVEIGRDEFIVNVSRRTFEPRPNYYVVFVLVDLVDEELVRLKPMWLVPSQILGEKSPGSEEIRFAANLATVGKGLGQWEEYVVTLEGLPSKILGILDGLEPAQTG
jgi:hypothetical protein